MSNKFNTSLGITNLAGLVILLVLFFFKSDKIYYVDSAKLINNYKGMSDARKAYQQKATVWKSNIDTLVSEIQGELKKYEKESPKMTVKERELSRQLIQSKQQQLGDYQKAAGEKAAQEDGEMTRQVISEINSYIKEYAKGKGYKIVLAATEYGNIAYAQEGMDITEDVLRGLNNKYAGK